MRRKRNTGESFVREFKTSQRAEALWKYCMLSFLFFFHILRCLSQWEVIFCHKLWEEVNVRPPPAQVLCPNHPVTGKLFGKTGLVGQRVVGEHRVVPWRAGAVGVLTGGGVLLEGHRQVQVLLSGERSKVRLWCHRQTISLLVVRWLEQEHCVHCFLKPSDSTFSHATAKCILTSKDSVFMVTWDLKNQRATWPVHLSLFLMLLCYLWTAAVQGDSHLWRSLIKSGHDLPPAVWRSASAMAQHASTPSWSCTWNPSIRVLVRTFTHLRWTLVCDLTGNKAQKALKAARYAHLQPAQTLTVHACSWQVCPSDAPPSAV